MSKTALVAPTDLQNPHELPRQTLSLIIDEFSLLHELRPQLGEKAIRYVIDADDPAFLLELSGEKQAITAMSLMGGANSGNWGKIQSVARARGRLLDAMTTVPFEVCQRLGETYAAIRHAHQGTSLSGSFPGAPEWLIAFLTEVVIGHLHGKAKAFPLVTMETLFQHAGVETGLLVAPSLDPDFNTQVRAAIGWSSIGWTTAFQRWGDYYAKHLDAVRRALQLPDAERRLFVLDALNTAKCPLEGVADLLVKFGCGSSKTIREAVLQMLGSPAETGASPSELRRHVRPMIEELLSGGDASERNEAAALLWRLYGEQARDRLIEHASTEKAQRVKQTIERLLSVPDTDPALPSPSPFLVELPPVEIPVGVVPLPDAAKEELERLLAAKYAEAEKQFAAEMVRHESLPPAERYWRPHRPATFDLILLRGIFEFIEGKTKQSSKCPFQQYFWNLPPLEHWKAPEVQLVHIVRLTYAAGMVQIRDNTSLWVNQPGLIEAYRASCQPPFGLRELDAAFVTLPGARPGLVPMGYLAANNPYHSQFDWEPAAIWPAFQEQRSVLYAALGPSPNRGRNYSNYDYSFPDKRRNAFRVLAMFPALPLEFVPALWEMALGDSKSDRTPAQNALATIEGKTEKILVALQDGRQETRAAAAEWLGRLNDQAAIEPLKAAFRKEKQEYVKGVYMSALEALGADVEEFLDRQQLIKEAEAGLGKKRPKGMDWFPVNALPAVHWQDTGQPADPRILHWWVVQTVQQKSPTCGPLLRRYLQMCRPADAAALGKFVLSAWISQDTRGPTQEEAAAKASKDTDAQFAQYGTSSWFLEAYKDRDGLYRMLFQQYSSQFLGSAIGEKGMLALVSATGNADCVKLCEQYLRKYFGHRLAQCKALIEVLAWMNHPLAIQLLLSIGNRFRTKALRQAATEYVQALAEREGWTIDELADRTIPDAGFARPVDEDGKPTGTIAELILDYGPRFFTVRLDDELDPVITRDDGKTVKAPPAPAKSDDAEKAKAARKSFSDAKKIVKEIVKRQTERFYEALCTQRSWRFDDWQRYLAQHPIVGKICTRVVWSAFEAAGDGQPDRFVTNFRPLEDGSLTNELDDAVTCQPTTLIRVAHDCNTPADARPLWIQHLQDYDVTPPFAQFGRDVYELPTGKGDATAISDFEGYLLTTFQLRGKATRLGWLRGEAEDGGMFVLYRKPFPSLALQAILEFTGSFLPEEDIPAALNSLSFEAIRSDKVEENSWSRTSIPLKKIPPVLLSECYNDVRQIAAEGSGYDPEWKKKSYF